MKSPLALIAGPGLLLLAALTAASLAGCGQPGALYMPKPPTRAAARATPPNVPAAPAVPTNPAEGTPTNGNSTDPLDPSVSPTTTQPVPAAQQ